MSILPGSPLTDHRSPKVLNLNLDLNLNHDLDLNATCEIILKMKKSGQTLLNDDLNVAIDAGFPVLIISPGHIQLF